MYSTSIAERYLTTSLTYKHCFDYIDVDVEFL